jgi:hypothetical protein
VYAPEIAHKSRAVVSSHDSERLSELCYENTPRSSTGSREAHILAGYFYYLSLVPTVEMREWETADFTREGLCADLGWPQESLRIAGCELGVGKFRSDADHLKAMDRLLQPKREFTFNLILAPDWRARFSALIGKIPAGTHLRQRLAESFETAKLIEDDDRMRPRNQPLHWTGVSAEQMQAALGNPARTVRTGDGLSVAVAFDAL